MTARISEPEGNLLVHIVNYTGGMSRPICAVIPISGMSLRINRDFARAVCLVNGKEIDVDEKGNVELPEIEEFECVLLE